MFRPWEVGRLTPFQVKEILFVERDKQGAVVLDPPVGDEPAELSWEDEWRREWIKRGITDPDVLRLLVERSMTSDVPAVMAIEEDEPDED